LEEKLAEAMKSSQSSVNQNKLQQIQEVQTIAGNKLNVTSDLRSVKPHPKTPVGKLEASEITRS